MNPTLKRIESHKDLVAWHKAVALAGKVYAATRRLPSEERDGLGQQLRRAAVSVASNIAEGAARHNRGAFLQHLHAARSSLSEVETQMTIAVAQDFLRTADAALDEIETVDQALASLISRVMSSHRQAHANACAPLRVRTAEGRGEEAHESCALGSSLSQG